MKSIFLTMLAVAALSSCNNDDNNNLDVPSGKTTFASVNIQIKAPGTYATPTDDNAVAEEQKINTLKLYVFSGGVLETAGTITVDGTNKGTSTIKTTTGAKEIYALVNPNSEMTATVGSTLVDFKKKVVKALAADIATANQFAMIGSVATTLGVQDEPTALANPIAITVTRAAAKTQLQYNTGTVRVANWITAIGNFSAPVYQLAQMNTNMFITRNAYEPSPKGLTAEQFDVAENDGTYDHLTAISYTTAPEQTALDANFIAAVNPFDFLYANSRYTAENVNEAPTTGNVTFAMVRLKFTPTTITGLATPDNGDGTFYVVTLANGSKNVYVDGLAANAAQQAIDGKNAKSYNKGLCYYRVNLRDINKTNLNEKYAVLRNHFYKINITEVNSLGGNSPIDPEVRPTDPETPLEVETNISADITIENWVVVDMNEPLN